MANTVKMKQSAVAGKAPTTAQLALGELAINTVDGKLFLKKNVGGTETIVDVTGAASGVSSFNTRNGAVTLQSGDVTGALGYTPANNASPALTGTPTAPTAAVGASNTQIATTAFVGAKISGDVGVANSSLVKTAINASGAAPIFAARAWVNFGGVGAVAIRASGNVSSITDNGVGDYTVNFSTAMPDNYYCVSGEAATGGGVGTFTGLNYLLGTVSSIRMQTKGVNESLYDAALVCAAVFR